MKTRLGTKAQGQPELVPGKSRFLRRKRIGKPVRDVERGMKATDRLGMPNDLPAKGKA